MPPLNTAFAVVVTAERFSVPAVRVTKPVNVLVLLLSLSTKLPVPLIVVVPATVIAPVVLNVNKPVTARFCGIATAAVPLIVVPPAPANVNPAAPVKAMLLDDQVIAVVAVIVLPPVVPIVALGTVNVPAV